MSTSSADFKAALRKERRLMLQYAIGGGLFTGLSIWLQNPWLALPVYGLLLVLLVLRYRRTALVMRVQAHLSAQAGAESGEDVADKAG